MKDLKGKKLLILGGSPISIEIVLEAQKMGIYTIVTDWYDTKRSPAKLVADEYWNEEIFKPERIAQLIKEHQVDGVFTSFTDSYLLQYQRICELSGLPCYATKEAFETAVDKDLFKRCCQQHGVPVVPEYDVETFDPSVLSPQNAIIIKPVDNSGARGITYCDNAADYPKALEYALSYSQTKHVIIEKFIQNGGTSMSVRYIAVDGDISLQVVGDRYVLDDTKGKALITAAAFYPSKHTDEYIRTLDDKVKNMFRSLGLKNGALFMESFWTPEGIFFYEMGLRLSGGKTYQMTEIATGVNELHMLIRFALSGQMCDEDTAKKIDPYLNGKYAASFTIPLRKGTIASVEGLDEIKALPGVYNMSELHKIGDEIKEENQGTLAQLLARISIVADGEEKLADIIKMIIERLSVKDTDGNEMFITSKLEDIYKDYSK